MGPKPQSRAPQRPQVTICRSPNAPGVLRALEFDRIVEAVRGFALTPMGDERLARLAPSSDPQKVPQLLAATTEAAGFVERHGVLPLRASADLPQILSALAVQGRALEPVRLLALAAFLESVDDAGPRSGSSRDLSAARPDRTAAASFAKETAQTREKIDPSGEVVDHASPELRIIRERLRKQRSRLRSTLESYLRGKDTRSTCRSRSSPNGTAATCSSSSRSTAAAFPASCTGRRRAAPACSSNRSAPSRSTTTSSRSRSRKPRKCGASCSR